MTMQEQEASEGLAAIKASRERLLAQARWSWGRHAAFGGIMAALVGAQALPTLGQLVVTALVLLAIAAVVQSDRARKGVWINGWRSGRTRPYTLAMALLSVGAILVGAWLNRSYGLWQAPLALCAAIFLMGTLGSKQWERIYRRELEADL